MAPARYGSPPNYYFLHWGRVSTFVFKKFKPVLAMLILRNLRTAGSPLPVLTNRVLLFFKLEINF
jgi:hypothetical protein